MLASPLRSPEVQLRSPDSGARSPTNGRRRRQLSPPRRWQSTTSPRLFPQEDEESGGECVRAELGFRRAASPVGARSPSPTHQRFVGLEADPKGPPAAAEHCPPTPHSSIPQTGPASGQRVLRNPELQASVPISQAGRGPIQFMPYNPTQSVAIRGTFSAHELRRQNSMHSLSSLSALTPQKDLSSLSHVSLLSNGSQNGYMRGYVPSYGTTCSASPGPTPRTISSGGSSGTFGAGYPMTYHRRPMWRC